MRQTIITVLIAIVSLIATSVAQAKETLLASVAVVDLREREFSLRELLPSVEPALPLVREAGQDDEVWMITQGGEVSFQPAFPRLEVGKTLNLRWEESAPEEVEVYVRDAHIASWDKAYRKLTAKSVGKTELILIVAKNLHIVPVEVLASGRALAQAEIEVPASVGLEFTQPALRKKKKLGVFKHNAEELRYRDIEIQLYDERSELARYGGGKFKRAGSPSHTKRSRGGARGGESPSHTKKSGGEFKRGGERPLLREAEASDLPCAWC